MAVRLSAPQSAPLDDPTALARFGKIDVVARLIVEGYMIGQHKSPFKGSSVEFVEHRQYYPGDEIRHIDWRAFGKTGRYYIKEFEEETNLRAYLLVDGSGSMAYGQSTLSKFDYARQMAAALGYLLLAQRDSVGMMTFDTQVRERIDPSANPKNFRRITDCLESWNPPGHETSLASVFEQLIPLLKRRSLVFLISDFFDDLKPLTHALKQFRHARHEVVLLQVVAPEEEDFPFSRPTQFRSLERSRRILVDPHRLRALYLEQYRKFEANLTRICGNAGVDFHKVVTSDPYQKSLGAYLDARARRKEKR